MPFKLKFKKTKRYEVSNKNAFVVGVYMLDNTFMECTLSSSSTGSECLESIGQKIELNQLQYFGLRFVTRKLQFRWIDPDKAVKKQLDKQAHSNNLYFGVMFYVARAHKLLDEVARYQYFLQLKTDIVDRRLPCSLEQAISFGAYSLQAEFGDHDPEKHIPEAFKEYPVLPKPFSPDEPTLLELLREVLSGHQALQGVHPLAAEIQFIREAQQLDGYGMEYYVAKDMSARELYLGTCYTGVSSRYVDGQAEVFYKWTEIARVSQSKRMLGIDTSKSSVHYQMEDPDTTKYLCRMCQLQQKFYKSNKAMLSQSLSDVSSNSNTDQTDSKELSKELVSKEVSKNHHEDHQAIQKAAPPQIDIPDVVEASTKVQYSQNITQQQQPPVHPDQPVFQSGFITDEYLSQSQHSLDNLSNDPRHAYTDSGRYGSSSSESHANVSLNLSQPSINAPSQQPCSTQSLASSTDPNYEGRLAALPAYRPAPDYQAVMQQRMYQQQPPQTIIIDPAQQQASQHLAADSNNMHVTLSNIGNTHVYNHPQILAYSQPEIHSTLSGGAEYQHEAYGQPHSVYANVFDQESAYNNMHLRPSNQAQNQVIHTTYSTPDLHSPTAQQYFNQETILPADVVAYHYKPPPPYPRTSNSTPDLATQAVCSSIGDSPDLVSRRNLGNVAGNDLAAQAELNRSIENLAEQILDSPGLLVSDIDSNQTVKQIRLENDDDDDNSSEHSYATFHIKDMTEDEGSGREKTNMFKNKSLLLNPSDLKCGDSCNSSLTSSNNTSIDSSTPSLSGSGGCTPIKIRHVAAKEAPPQTNSAKIAVRRESFRRIMISNSANMDARGSNRVSRNQDNGANQQLSPIMDSSNVSSSTPGQMPETSDSKPSSSADITETPIKYRTKKSSTELPDCTLTTNEPLKIFTEQELDEEDPIMKRLSMGPLKLAALNGLTPTMGTVLNDDARAPRDDRRRLLERQLEEGRVFAEFEQIPRKALDKECTTALQPENKCRNRFRDVLPYEYNRVKLTTRYDNPTGYTNASHIKLSSGDLEWWYLASQAPTAGTMEDFWQMVWEYNVHVVVMLTDVIEQGKKKCEQYWPEETGEKNKIRMEDFEVVLQLRSDSHYYQASIVCLRYLPLQHERVIWHLQYTTWPDHGCPLDTFGFLGFLDEIESMQRLAEFESDSSKKFPIVVHCTAGVGRTGVVILTQVMKACLEHNQEIDLPKALASLRQQRMFTVQTVGQYSFVYKTLIQYLKNTRLI